MTDENLLRISSLDRDRVRSRGTTDFVVNYKQASAVQTVKRISIQSAHIMNTFYNINVYKQRFVYKIGGVIQPAIVIPVGQYNIDTLIIAMETAGVGIGLTMALDPITYKISFTTTTAIEYLPHRTQSDPLYAENNPMGEVMGILESSGGDVLAYTATGVPDLTGETEVYIVSTNLSDGSNMISSELLSVPVVIVIPITSCFGSVSHYLSQAEDADNIIYNSQRLGKNLQDIDIRIFDREGRLLDNNGADSEIIVKILS